MAPPAVAIDGLVDLQRALRTIDRALPREMRKVFNEAAQSVVTQARGNARTRMERRAATTVRAASQQRAVAVKLGSARVPFALGAEFGAERNKNRLRRAPGGTGVVRYVGYRQFKDWGGNQYQAGATNAPGYFFYPAVRSEGTRVVNDALKGLDGLLRQNGFS